MRVKIRIYNPYDLDIIALTEVKGFSVANAMKQTLKYYAAGKRFLVEIPKLTDHLKNERYSKGFYVDLDDEEDIEAINFIKSIPDGLRNAFMKNIFRASFEVAPVSLYIGDGGANYIASMIANPRYGRHPVQREIVDAVQLADGEIGVIISDDKPDVSKLPQGEKPKRVIKKTARDSLRDATQNAFQNAQKKEEEKRMERKMILDSSPVDESMSDDLDALLDAMM